ncbi:hypothetical protein C8J57DRAFT_1257675 [Mycena rebaudengoi]|nr:hypothetical protein C8J57DRAFT_1257675 [Mycena rebaudengoi]
MFGRGHSALVEALCLSLKLHHLRRRCLAQVPELYPLQQSLAGVFVSNWRLHNVRRSTFSLGRSSVLLAKAPPPPPEMSGSSSRIGPTATSSALSFESIGDSTVFGGEDSALVEALCHPPKLCREF